MLRLNDPLTVATGFDRPNLRFEVLHPKNKQRALEDVLEGYAEQSGIVYCSTRKTVEAVCEALNAAGYAATRYHAGLSDEERRRNQEDFQHDTKRVMVATNAFGMGIDKSNVRCVVHFNMPGRIEAYYQEAGRAGRDGAAADCLLFHSLQDEFTARFLIDRTSEDSALDEEQLAAFKQQEHERLGLMVAYCNTTRCLRQELLGYFGDEELTEPCGNCSVCDGEYEERDITVQTRKILSCVSRMGGRFGVNMVVNVLRGDKKGRVFQFHLHQLPTYGILSDTPREQVQGMIAHLTAEGYLRQTNDRFPLLTLGSKARAALFEGESVVWRMPLAAPDAPGARKGERGASGGEHDVSGGRRGERRSKFADANAPIDEALLAALRRLRAEIAQKAHQPAYVVFSDAALLDMCRKHPLNEEEFLAVSGVGNFKLEKYGQAFLAVLRGEIAQDTEGDEGASPEKAGQPWSEEEDARLRLATQLGYGPPAIAQVHGRTVQAIEARMKKLGIPNTAK
jgi:ATP-dependent DNA helicase RecQ